MPKKEKSKGIPKKTKINKRREESNQGINIPALVFLVIALLANIIMLILTLT